MHFNRLLGKKVPKLLVTYGTQKWVDLINQGELS
jgi:hypothetical protein